MKMNHKLMLTLSLCLFLNQEVNGIKSNVASRLHSKVLGIDVSDIVNSGVSEEGAAELEEISKRLGEYIPTDTLASEGAPASMTIKPVEVPAVPDAPASTTLTPVEVPAASDV